MIDVAKLNKSKTTAMVIRHADRGEVPSGKIDQPLNELGEQHAFELGQKLKGFKNYKFFTSPVDRCQGTTEFIQKGLFGTADKSTVTLSQILGRPGPFVTDHKNNAFSDYNCYTVVNKQITHEPLKGIRPIEEGTKLLMNLVLSEMDKAEDGTLLVFVSHDAIVGPIEYELTGETFNEKHWPEFADGFFVEKSENGKKVIRNGQYFDLRKF